jgi:hypothetical protein
MRQTWSNSGTDSTFFSINSGGVLTITARDFEAPADVGSNNTYEVTINATDLSSNVKTQVLTVTITNVNEAPTGAVTISGTAIQGNVLTVVSTLKDPDGAGTAKVQWLRDGASIANATSSSYTLGTSDVGKAISAKRDSSKKAMARPKD